MRFPDGFLWGTATSSFQVEGLGDRLGLSIWDSFVRQPGRIRDGSDADIACDHFHRYPEDIALTARAGLKAYRFSTSWPRVQPLGFGPADPAGLDFYERLTDAALAAGIAPWVCLFHWDLPQALQDRGGWRNRGIADRFAAYAEIVARRLGDRVTHWIAMNEPQTHAVMGHGLGEHAPGMGDDPSLYGAIHHQNLAQGAAFQALRAGGGARFRLGTVLSLIPTVAAEGKPENEAAAAMWDAIWNRAFLDPLLQGGYPAQLLDRLAPLIRPGDLDAIRHDIDFLGVNYYSRAHIRADPNGFLGTNWGALPEDTPRTAIGWSIEPSGLYDQLVELRDRYGNPLVYVTENGAACPDVPGPDGLIDDRDRIAFMRDHIAAMHRAIGEGARVGGYFAWTLLDNFEWALGYTARFGLVAVDRLSQARAPKASYDWFAGVAKRNAL